VNPSGHVTSVGVSVAGGGAAVVGAAVVPSVSVESEMSARQLAQFLEE